MKRLLSVFIVFAASFAGGAPEDFTVRAVTSTNVFRLSEAKGKYVALHFLLKTECPFCIRHTASYMQESAAWPEVIQVFLKPDTEAEIQEWARELPAAELARLPVYRDPDAALAKAYEVPHGYQFHGQTVHYPALILLGPDGREVFRYVGKSNADRFSTQKFKAKLDELKSGASSRLRD